MKQWLEDLAVNLSAIAWDIASISAATLVLLLLYFLLTKLFKKVYRTLHEWKDVKIPDLKIQEYRILSAGHFTYILIRLAKFLRLVIVLVLFYLYMIFILGQLPWTRPLYDEIIYILVEAVSAIGSAVLSYLPDFALLILIIVVAYYINRLAHLIFTAIGKGQITIKGFYQDWAYPTYQIVRFLIIAFAAAVAFPYLPGSDSSAFKGISIFIGALFTLGSTSAISNVIAGIILTYMRPFKPGDRVKIADTVGDVLEKSLLVTRISTIKNIEVSIPNALILSNQVLNYSASAKEVGLIVNTSITIGYDVQWRKVHELLISAAKSTELISEEPAPFILQLSLDDYTVKYELNAYTEHPEMMAKIYSDLHQNIQDAFAGAGVEIMSPSFVAYRDGGKSTVPFFDKSVAQKEEPAGEEKESC